MITPQRTYLQAQPVPTGDGWQVALDAKRVQTPAGAALSVPDERLAAAIAAEWNTQEKELRPATMPLTQLAMTAQDRVAPHRTTVATALPALLDGDLLRFPAGEPDLAVRQQVLWQPVRDWLAETYAIDLPQAAGLTGATPTDAGRLANALAQLDSHRLCILQLAAGLFGSLGLALAFVSGRITAAQAVDAAETEADWQAGRWGRDAEADARRAGVQREADTLQHFITLL